MDSEVCEEFDVARIDVNFYDWNMSGMEHNGIEHPQVFTIIRGRRRKGMVIGEAPLQTALHIHRQVEFVPEGLHAYIGDAQRTIGALDPDTPFSNLHVIDAGLQKVSSDLAHLLLDFRSRASRRSCQPYWHTATSPPSAGN